MNPWVWNNNMLITENMRKSIWVWWTSSGPLSSPLFRSVRPMIFIHVEWRAVLLSRGFSFRCWGPFSTARLMSSFWAVAKKSIRDFQSLFTAGSKSFISTHKKAKYALSNPSCKNPSPKTSFTVISWTSNWTKAGKSSPSESSYCSSLISKNFIFTSCARICSTKRQESTNKSSTWENFVSSYNFQQQSQFSTLF